MTVGTKSLLFGVHQFLWHPFTVARAWKHLYGRWPCGWLLLAIFLHDIGYVGCPNMDGPEGKQHPRRGARWMYHIFLWFRPGEYDEAREWHDLILFHSRSLCKASFAQPSKLCDADKLSMLYDPEWFYLLRAQLSGEIREYRANAEDFIRSSEPNYVWFRWLRQKMQQYVKTKIAYDDKSLR